MDRPASAEGLLAPGEPPAAQAYRWSGQGRALVVCDHASARIPQALGRLGLPVEALYRHVAVDVGAARLTRALADGLDTPALLAGYSRLVVDCNRAPDAWDAFATDGDGHPIPGNETLTGEDRERRLAAIHRPYHATIGRTLAALEVRGAAALVAVHSFTPVFRARHRPWVAGVLYGRDERLAVPLRERLERARLGRIGDNEPYSGRWPSGYTVNRHAAAAGRLHVSLEIRQDELLTPAGLRRWATVLVDALGPLLRGVEVLP